MNAKANRLAGLKGQPLESRRAFLQKSGAAMLASGLLFTACRDDEMMPMPMMNEASLGTGDVAVLNYAYALEQLEAAFYTAVVNNNFYPQATDEEKRILSDLMKHEVAHRDFLKVAIESVAQPLPTLEFDFSSINFGNRTSVLMAAKTFEDLGVGAYNGAGQLLQSPDLLVIAGKIVSIEARHAAAIRSILDADPTSFAGDDIIDMNGLDLALQPADVFTAAASFIKTSIDISGMPSA
jgi:hypothetical protein